MPAHDFGVVVGRALLDALAPLQHWLSSVDAFERLLVRHGWRVPPEQSYFPQIKTTLSLVDRIPGLLDRLESLLGTADPTLDEVTAALSDAIDVVDDLYKLASGPVPSGLPFPLNTALFWQSFPLDLVQTQIVHYLAARQQALHAVLSLFGVIDRESVAEDPVNGRSAHEELRLNWLRLKDIIVDPRGLMATVYGWGGAFDHAKLLNAVERAMLAFHAPVQLEIPPDDVLLPYYEAANPAFDQVRRLRAPLLSDIDAVGTAFEAGLSVLPVPPDGQKQSAPVGVFIAPYFEGQATTEVPLGGRFVLQLSAEFGSGSAIGMELRPGSVKLGGTTATGSLKLSVALAAQPLRPFLLLGAEDGTRLEAQDATVTLELVGPATVPDLRVRLSTSALRGVIEVGSGDGFLNKIFGEEGVEGQASLGLQWSAQNGLSFQGAGGLTADIPANLTLGPLTIHKLTFGIASSGSEASGLALVTASAALGPVTATVQEVGVQLKTRTVTAGERRGLLGDLDLSFGFRAPTGVGVAISAGPVTGGGFLFFDDVNKRYGGALELKVYSVNVKAFGVIETQLPEGSGFSFAIVISAEFTPIQLGLGFTLTGVGGIIGINRRIDEDGLRAAVRTGALDNLLFPTNLTENAPQIIADLRAILPAAEGRYVFGPMARIGWGTPTLIQAKLGIILELPGPRLALLGEVSALLPKKERGLVTLNMSVAGLLDFPRKFFAMDASLHHSQVGGYPISGDMAMRLSWGDTPSFALAVGGFNPGFQPPPSFPALRRVAVDLGVSGNPSLTLQGYFAITSNTAQVGALCELNASGSGIRLYGRVQFDAIFVFSPFSFEAAISAQVRVSFKGRGIGVHLRGVLSGPSPWRVRGEVCVSILFWDACLGFDKSFGSAARVELPAVNPWDGKDREGVETDTPALQKAVQDVRNWTPEPPPGSLAVVSLASAESGEEPIDPLGAATLRQRVCPLEVKLQRFGALQALGPANFVLDSITVNQTLAVDKKDVTFVKEPFAPAQYFQMKDSEKLSAKSFEPLKGGFTVAPKKNNLAAGSGKTNEVQYRTKVIGETDEQLAPLPPEHLDGMRKRSMTGLAGLRRLGVEAYVDPTRLPRFTVADELFVVADINTLTARADVLLDPKSKIEATLALRTYLADNPDARADLQVVPRFEMAA